MDQLKGSLRFVSLPAVTQFIVGLGTTGRLKLTQGAWSAELTLRDGQIIGAQLGTERGRAALEGMVLLLSEAEFVFLDGVVDGDAEPIIGRDELGGFLAALVAERERLLVTPNALSGVPRLIDNGPEASQVTIQAGALQLLPMLVYGHTLEQIALRRGVARTLREIALLREGGLVRVEPGRVTEAPTPATPAARAVAAVSRPLRPVSTEGHAIPLAAPRRATWWQSSSGSAAAQAKIELPRPRLVKDEPKLVEVSATVAPAAQPETSRSWRKTVRGFFIAERLG
jgi:hypothetical protein